MEHLNGVCENGSQRKQTCQDGWGRANSQYHRVSPSHTHIAKRRRRSSSSSTSGQKMITDYNKGKFICKRPLNEASKWINVRRRGRKRVQKIIKNIYIYKSFFVFFLFFLSHIHNFYILVISFLQANEEMKIIFLLNPS